MVEECSDTRIQGLMSVSAGRRHQEGKQVPFGVESDALSSRGLGLELWVVRDVQARMLVQPRTLVNMLGEEAMVELRAKPQLQWIAEVRQCKWRRCGQYDGVQRTKRNTVLRMGHALLPPPQAALARGSICPRNGILDGAHGPLCNTKNHPTRALLHVTFPVSHRQ